MKIWELDRTEGKKYKIVNGLKARDIIKKTIWTVGEYGDLFDNDGIELAFHFTTGHLLDFEFEEVKELTGYERVKKGEKYYYFDNTYLISQKIEGQTKTVTTDENQNTDDRRYVSGNYFSTLEAAIKEGGIITLYQKIKRFSVENGWKDEMLCDVDFEKYLIYINYKMKIFEISSDKSLPDILQVHFVSKEIAEKAIEIFGDEIKKVYGIED